MDKQLPNQIRKVFCMNRNANILQIPCALVGTTIIFGRNCLNGVCILYINLRYAYGLKLVVALKTRMLCI